jgi:ABC-2 type transport system ATP-binding protein
VTGPAVEVDGLVKRYGPTVAVDGVSLRLSPGEIVALLGPNGAGKTTTVEIIEGYRRGDGGTVRVLGADPWRAGPDHRARVGLMLQGGGLDPRSNAREALRILAALHMPARDPEELLRLVGLASVARTRVRRLSGGERQRLSLALALVGDPELVILDEPTAGMDPQARRLTRDLVAGLRDAGRAVLLTTHDLVDVERLADRAVILHHGRVVAEGTPTAIAAAGTARLWFRTAAPLDAAGIAGLAGAVEAARPGTAAAIEPTDGGYAVTGPESDPTIVAVVATWFASHHTRLVELRTGAPTLEDAYLALTGDATVERVA